MPSSSSTSPCRDWATVGLKKATEELQGSRAETPAATSAENTASLHPLQKEQREAAATAAAAVAAETTFPAAAKAEDGNEKGPGEDVSPPNSQQAMSRCSSHSLSFDETRGTPWDTWPFSESSTTKYSGHFGWMDFSVGAPPVPAGPRIPWESAAEALQAVDSKNRQHSNTSSSTSNSCLGSAAPAAAAAAVAAPEGARDPPRMVIGVCAMRMKTDSRPMREILERLENFEEFRVVVFDERVILEDPIEKWPVVDGLIAFFSTGFPLNKAIAYAKKYQPILLNDVSRQQIIRNRLAIYNVLEQHDIPHPSYVVVDYNAVRRGEALFSEGYDYLSINGQRINKPFIEKPQEADNHDNWIYYPKNAGGGCKKLYRKQQNSSSSYFPDIHQVRKDGVYLYEEFLPTFGTDVKVYTVGPLFAHAEARKSPSVDGVVCRSADGKEVRYPVILTEIEKCIAFKLVRAFQQVVCGFDILRTSRGPFVCDVNGFSFVKSNVKYYDDCSSIIRLYFLKKLADRCARSALHSSVPSNASALRRQQQQLESYLAQQQRRCPHGGTALSDLFWLPPGHAPGVLSPPMDGDSSHGASRMARCLCMALESEEEAEGVEEELRTVVVVMRHGDRRPKQKLKFLSTQPLLLQYFNEENHKKELKLKSPEELRDLLDRNTEIITALGRKVAAASHELQAEKQAEKGYVSGGTGGDTDSPGLTAPEVSPLQNESASSTAHRTSPLEFIKRELRLHKQLQKVLLQGDGFAGINRKIQLKPKKWVCEPESLSASCPVVSPVEPAQQQQQQQPVLAPQSQEATQQQQPKQEQQQRQTDFRGPAFVAEGLAQCSTAEITRTCSVPTLTSFTGPLLSTFPTVSSISLGETLTSPYSPASTNVVPAIPSAGVVAGAVAAAAAAAAAANWQEKAQRTGGGTSTSLPPGASGSSSTSSHNAGYLESCVVVAKWGGELTAIGRKQAEDLGQRFRYQLYPGDSAGLLRLHSTFRHDFKIYTSDEGRCQITSAAFTKGFLDLEGELTPILVALVIHNRKAYALLDESAQCASEKRMLKQCLDFLLNLNDEQLTSLKQRVVHLLERRAQLAVPQASAILGGDRGAASQEEKKAADAEAFLTSPQPSSDGQEAEEPWGPERLIQNCPEGDTALIPKQLEALQRLQSPLDRQTEILSLLKVFLELLDPLIEEATAGDSEAVVTPLSAPQSQKQAAATKLAEMKSRWQKVYSDWYKAGMFDSSKISDILDMIRYELIHHCYLLSRDAVQTAINIHNRIKELQEAVSAFAYAHSNEEKLRLAVPVVGRLIRKVLRDVTFFRSDDTQQKFPQQASNSSCTSCNISEWGTSLGAAAAAAAAATSEEAAAASATGGTVAAAAAAAVGASSSGGQQAAPAGVGAGADGGASLRGSRRGTALNGSPRSSSSCMARASSPSAFGARSAASAGSAHRSSGEGLQSPRSGGSGIVGVASGSAPASGSPGAFLRGVSPAAASATPDLRRSLNSRCSPGGGTATRSSSTQLRASSISRHSLASSSIPAKGSSARRNSRSSGSSIAANAPRALGRCAIPGGSSNTSGAADIGLRPLCGAGGGGGIVSSGGPETVVINSNDLWAHQQTGGRGKKEKALKQLREEQVQQMQQIHMEHVQSELKLLQQQDQDIQRLAASVGQQQQASLDNAAQSQELQHPQKQPTTPCEQSHEQQLQLLHGHSYSAAAALYKGNALPSQQNSDDKQQLLLQRQDSSSPERSGATVTGEAANNPAAKGKAATAGAEEEEEHEDDDPHQHEVAAQIRLKEGEAHLFGIRSPWRIVRSRFYVTSSSHVEALLNVLLLSHRAVSAKPQNATHAEAVNTEASGRAAAGAAGRSSDPPCAEGASEAMPASMAKASGETEEGSGGQQFKPILDPGLRDWVGQCELHYLSHIVFRVWERRRAKPAQATASSGSQNKQQPGAAPKQRTPQPQKQQQQQQQQEEKGRYRLEIFFSTGARDGFGENFYLLERKARQQQQQQRNKQQQQQQQQQQQAAPQPVPSARQQLWQEVHQQEEEEQRSAALRGSDLASRFSCMVSPAADSECKKGCTRCMSRGGGSDASCACCCTAQQQRGQDTRGSGMDTRHSCPGRSSCSRDPSQKKTACGCSCGKPYTNRVPPYCEIAPLLPLGRSIEVGDFEALMNEVLRRFGEGTVHRTRADKAKSQ